jgi:hypothetical protein
MFHKFDNMVEKNWLPNEREKLKKQLPYFYFDFLGVRKT